MAADWDVDSYRTEYESEEHWELKRNFMLAHKDRFPEAEMVCLAQVFINIELLGCRYPAATMTKVAELAKGVVESFREKKKNTLKRTFVAASEAANARVTGQKTPGCREDNSSQSSKKPKLDVNPVNDDSLSKNDSDVKSYSTAAFAKKLQDHISLGGCIRNDKDVELTKSKVLKELSGPFSSYVVFLLKEPPYSSLLRTSKLNNFKLKFNFSENESNQTVCKVLINKELLVECVGDNEKTSRVLAAKAALEKLQSVCYTVKVKANFVSEDLVSAGTLADVPAEAQKSDIGEKIMKIMGWSGGGLGPKQQGILEPIDVTAQYRRAGLGLKNPKKIKVKNKKVVSQFESRAKIFIEGWMRNQGVVEDLVFSNEFSNEERKILHRIASGFALRSKSYGKAKERHLVISKKQPPWVIVNELLRLGGESSKYELLEPGQAS